MVMRPWTTRHIALLALLVAVCVVGRLALQMIPNVQPVTAIVIMIAVALGPRDGIIVATLTMVLSNVLMGFGLWTLGQVISYAVIALFSGFFGNTTLRHQRIFMSGYAFFAGLLYGFVISVTMMLLFSMPSFWAYYLQGLYVDLLHGAGNAAFYAVLSPVVLPLLERYGMIDG